MLKQLQDYIKDIQSGKVLTKSEGGFRPNSIRTYANAVRNYESFVSSHPDIDLKKMDLSRVQHRGGLAEQFEDHFRDFIEFLRGRGLKPNTIKETMMLINAMVRRFAERNYLLLPKVPIPKGQENPIITLPVDFVKTFVNYDKYDEFSPEHRYLWEVCATMLVTSLRVSDAVAIRPEDLMINGEVYLTKHNQKTGAKTTLPLPPQLYEKYLRNIEQYGSVYTKIDNEPLSFISRYLRSFFAQFPEMNEEYQGKKFYEIVHPHMLRKTAITTMLANGVSLDHVRFASGHKSDAIKRYQGWVDQTHKSEIHNYYKQFINS